MQIIRSIQDMQACSQRWRQSGLRIGCVPTMGYLHAGHTSLIDIAAKQCDVVVVTLFVNPTQFGPNEDLARYPSDEAGDLAKCEEHGATAIFAPAAAEMYAPDQSTWVDEAALTLGLCGANRPGHFRGVTTVVSKLFWAVMPDVAVFGEKDAQQLRVIERMVRDLNIPVQIARGPIVREPDGLAMSSRNAYLSADERARALCLSRSLDQARQLFAAGERDAEALCCEVRKTLASADEVDYVSLVDEETLEPVPGTISRPALLAIAARFSSTRLIDNLILRDNQYPTANTEFPIAK